MENTLILTQLSIPEVRQLLRDELERFFTERQIGGATMAQTDEVDGIELAIEITGLAKPTIYSLCSERKIPHSKKGKRLYFSRQELLEWLKQGKRKTQAEIAVEAENYRQKEKEAIQPTKPRNHFPKV